MCFQSRSGSSIISGLKKGQKVKVRKGVGFPRLKQDMTLTVYDIDGFSFITTSGHAFNCREENSIEPLKEFVDNPQLDDDTARRRYNRLVKRQ